MRFFQKLKTGLCLVMASLVILGMVAVVFHQTPVFAQGSGINGNNGAVTPPAAGAPGTAQQPAVGTEDDDTDQSIFQMLSSGAGKVVAELATMFLKLLAGLLWFILGWMGDLMDNTFILDGDIGEKLRSVWIIVRNFVNILFALALVVIAFMSAVGYTDDGGNYAIKKFIPKMALALIAVNFTFLAARIVLDINNVLTTAVFDIPRRVTNFSDIGPSGTATTRIFRKMKCLDTTTSVKELSKKVKEWEKLFPGVVTNLAGVCYAQGLDGLQPNAIKSLNDLKEVNGQKIIPLDSTTFSKKNFAWAMATQFQGLQNLNQASQLIDPSFTSLSINAIFSIIFAVIYATAYVALFIILLARLVVLWICIMLSPLVAVSIALPDVFPKELDIKEKFFTHAFVPLKMAIPMAFGYILISQMQVTLETSNVITDQVIDLSQGGEFAHDISFTSLLYGVASVAVIWMSVFMASKNVIGEGVVKTITGYVESAGKKVAKWPAYLPVLPVAGGNMSLSAIKTTFDEFQSARATSLARRDREMAQRQLSALGMITSPVHQALRKLEDLFEKGTWNKSDVQLTLRGMSDDSYVFMEGLRGIRKQWNNDPNAKQGLQEMFGMTYEDFDKKLSNNDYPGLRDAFKASGVEKSVTAGDYSGISMPATVNKSKLPTTFHSTLPASMKPYFTDTASTIPAPNLPLFMRDLVDRDKVNDATLKAFVTFLTDLAKVPEINAKMKPDGHLLARLKEIKDGDEAHKKALHGLYSTITTESEATTALGYDGNARASTP